MFAITSSNGRLLKTLPDDANEVFGLHQIFGVISEATFQNKIQSLKTNGDHSALSKKKRAASEWICKFAVHNSEIFSVVGCDSKKLSEKEWLVETPAGAIKIYKATELEEVLDRVQLGVKSTTSEDTNDKVFKASLALATLVLLLLFLTSYLFQPAEPVVKPLEIEPVTVEIKHEKQKAVPVPQPAALSRVKEQAVKDVEVKRAIQQDLGFLGLLGRKDLNKALGGAPTALKDASAGAGPGGKEGSGGELLVGLGQGVKRTTVGNTGVAGLGGVGTKGVGGGAGGYGNSMIGSGEGKALSTMPVSQDIVLEGGLDRSVIQATIAKYISQVRACYERGLGQNPGLNGQVTMNFEIGKEGALNFARVAKSSLGNTEVEECIAGRMMTWRFPKPVGGVTVKVSYPFLLRPVGT